MNKLIASILFIFLGLLTNAYAQLPPTKTQGTVSFITGGIGSDQSNAMYAAAKKWSVLIEMSQIDGSGRGVWIAGINVRILDSKQKTVLETVSDGPLMLLNAPAGQYEIEATYQSKVLKRSLTIKDKENQRVTLFWRS
mgnify:FL=1|jgi:hypothetical protein